MHYANDFLLNFLKKSFFVQYLHIEKFIQRTKCNRNKKIRDSVSRVFICKSKNDKENVHH